MNLSEYLVVGVAVLILLAVAAHIVRAYSGARAERRFLIRTIVLGIGIFAASLLTLWLLPERYQKLSSSMISGISFIAVLFMFGRTEKPSA